MSKRWDLTVSHKDRGDKYRNTKVGVIFEGDKGELRIRIDPGISISSVDGVYVTGYLPRERDEGARGNGGPRQRVASNDHPESDYLPASNDEIPF
jgi:hypothetical protein